MPEYRADFRDVKFNLLQWLDLRPILESEAFKEFDRGAFEVILEEALKVSKGSVASCNEAGDRVGAKWSDGRVAMAPGFMKAYQDLATNGWISPTSHPEFGGMGLPECVGTGISEFIMGANTSLSLTVLLTRGACHLIESFGNEELKKTYCEKMYSGRWAGTMCLTEAQAGSDLGDIKTKALKQQDGSYLISGEKIFITSGDHDLTENIIHAVLARTEGAPSGAKGLALFVVPKIRVNGDGSLGKPNDVACANIEHKLGIHGSPTCSLVFGANGACQGFLLGKERLGLLLMFQMMNTARYEVGVQGLAIASAANQAALAYSRERLQGRSQLDRGPSAPQVPIVQHPDVRRSLLWQSAMVQAMRALVSYTAWHLDMAAITKEKEHDLHQGLVELLTPICKAWCSDRGFEVSGQAMQCFGGYGYTAEFPAEQYLRDVKIASIYEGTNTIQALDLLGRKFKMQGGEPMRRCMNDAAETAKALASNPVFAQAAKQLGLAVKTISETLGAVAGRDDAALLSLLNAVPILESFGDLIGGDLLLRQAAIANDQLLLMMKEKSIEAGGEPARTFVRENEEARFYHNKVQAALFYSSRVLPFIPARLQAVKEADTTPMDAEL